MAYCSSPCAQSDDTRPVSLPEESRSRKAPIATDAESSAQGAIPAVGTDIPAVGTDIPVVGTDLDWTVEASSASSQTSSGGRRRRVMWASAAIMVGGIVVALVPVLVSTASSGASDAVLPQAAPKDVSETVPTNSVPSSEPSSPAILSETELRLAAIAQLESDLKDGALRVQRMAALALAQVSHEPALTFLRERLTSETSDLSRVDIAYGLALAGEEEGHAYLVGELKSKRRDVRVDAARRLVQLKDDAGRMTLVQTLDIKSHRLGAAAQLALLGDERGLAFLRQSFTDASSSAETKMRAAVGMGRAGDRGAVDFLKKILSEGHYVVDAAGALAALGETEAVPALLKQLELTSIRVRAASSLRRMGHKVDLRPLAQALKTGNSEGRIAAAEAILLLSAPQEPK